MANVNSNVFVPGMPLYRQVQDGIEELIGNRSGDEDIPLSDASLTERFGVSRITVRRAVDELVNAGLLYRIQGVGTFVRSRKLREKLTLTSFLDGWAQKTGRLDVRISAFGRIQAGKEIAKQLEVPIGVELVYVQRLRFQKKTLVAVDDRYLRPECCRHLTAQDIMTSSLVDYLRNKEKIDLQHGEMEIEARHPDARETKALGIKGDQPILIRRVTFFTKKNEAVLSGISTYRADCVSYRLTVTA